MKRELERRTDLLLEAWHLIQVLGFVKYADIRRLSHETSDFLDGYVAALRQLWNYGDFLF